MPYKSDKQRRFMHATHPDIAKRWDAEMRKKYKIKVGKLKGSLGEMNPETNEIKIDIGAHKKKGKLDKAELASTIKHEIMHVKHPKATEKQVYKATRKTKISPKEQVKLLSKLRHKNLNYKSGALKRKFKMGRVGTKPGDFIGQMNKIKRKVNNSQPPKRSIAIRGMV